MLNQLTQRTPSVAHLIFPDAGLILHSMLTSAGYEQLSGDRYDFSGTNRGQTPFVLFQYTLAGSGMLRFENKEYALHPGQAMLLYFPHNNRYWLPADGKWSFFYLCLHGSNVAHCWQRLVSSVGPVVDFRPNPGLIDAAAGLCGRILDSTITSPWQASSEAYAFTMQLMNECFPQPLLGTHSRSLPEPMRKAVDSIGRNLRHSPNIDTLAAAAGQSRFHFSRQFKKHLGMPPGEYVLREKLKAVVELLNTSDLPLADIAPLCGFSDPNYLIRVFKKLYGITPLQFRRRR